MFCYITPAQYIRTQDLVSHHTYPKYPHSGRCFVTYMCAHTTRYHVTIVRPSSDVTGRSVCPPVVAEEFFFWRRAKLPVIVVKHIRRLAAVVGVLTTGLAGWQHARDSDTSFVSVAL